MSIKKLLATKLAITTFVIASLLILATIIYFIIVSKNRNDIISVNFGIKSDSKVTPIVYLETGIGSSGYETRSYLIDSNGIHEMEKHARSFSRTFPSSALKSDYFPENYNIREMLGQLMVYYNTKEGPVYLFEHISSNLNVQDMRYTTLYNNDKATLRYAGDSSLFDLNEFDDHFYIFCYDSPDKSTGAFNEIITYKYTKKLELIGKFKIELNKMNLSYNNLVNDSLAIKNGNLLFLVRYNNRFYTASYNFENEKFDMRLIHYEPICHVVSDDNIYSIGTKGSKFVIERIYENNQTDYMEVDYPNGIIPTFGIRKQYVYGVDNVLYGSANDENGQTIIFSYNIESKVWDNWWTLSSKSNYKLADYKFVVREGETQFDLLPYNLV